MKRLHVFTTLTIFAVFCMCHTAGIQAQDLGEIEGTLAIKMNSTTGTPHIRLIEDDFSTGGSTRLSMMHQDNSLDYFELRGFLSTGSSNKHVGWYYNGVPRVVFSATHDGLAIGTSTPDQKLHVEITGSNGMKIQGNGTGDARLWINNGGGSHFLFDDNSDANAFAISSSNDFKIDINGAERFRMLKAGGQIGVNVTPLDSRQMLIDLDDKLYGLEVVNDHTSTAVGIEAEVISINAQNKFGVVGKATGSAGTGAVYGVWGSASTTPTNSYGVYCSGDLYYTGALAGPSDIKLKENIVELEPVLNKLLQLKAQSYTYKRDEFPNLNLASGRQKGFVAQDLQQLFPDIVELGMHATSVEDDMPVEILSVKYLEMIPILTKAIQEQQDIINKMQQEIDALKADK